MTALVACEESEAAPEQLAAMNRGCEFAERFLWPSIRYRQYVEALSVPGELAPDWWAGIFAMLAGAALAECGPAAGHRLVKELETALLEVKSEGERSMQ